VRRTFKLSAEEWLFARQFAYMDKQCEPYVYESNLLKKRKANEPKNKEIVPYLVVDEYGLLINATNKKGQWLRWEWEDVKSIRLYPLMYPWKASIYLLFNESDKRREKRKAKRYLWYMRRRYKHFHFKYCEDYAECYSLIFETRKGNGQFYIPSEWKERNKLAWLLETIELPSRKRINYLNTDDHWKIHLKTRI